MSKKRLSNSMRKNIISWISELKNSDIPLSGHEGYVLTLWERILSGERPIMSRLEESGVWLGPPAIEEYFTWI